MPNQQTFNIAATAFALDDKTLSPTTSTADDDMTSNKEEKDKKKGSTSIQDLAAATKVYRNLSANYYYGRQWLKCLASEEV